jgi:penicillin amidase
MDRLWQIEFWRKMSTGRLSEIVGLEALSLDKYVRTIGINRMVKDYMSRISDEDLLILKNYAAGVNKLVEQIHVYPMEFYIFWNHFEPYTPEDSVAISFIMMKFISSDWFFEM